MKILLVQVPTSHLGAGEKVYPLGLSRLSGTVPDYHEKMVLDMNIHPDPWPELKKILTGEKPDIVALSFRNLDPLAGHQTSYLSSLKTAALLTRAVLPESRIIAGGPAFSLFALRLMNEVPQIDVGLKGEGELVFPSLLEKDFKPAGIPGILWRDNSRREDNNIIVNPPGTPVNMDRLPPMDLKFFSPSDYMKSNRYVAAVGIEGKRGCDLWCGYCLYPLLGGNCMRLRAPSLVVDEMEMLHKEYGITLFHFTDSVVNRPADHFEAICHELIQRRLNVLWTGFFREDSFTRANLELAQKAGMTAIYFSADALTEYGLKLLNKRMSCQDILNASKMTAEHGVLTMCHFLISLPGETDAHIIETYEMLDRLLDIHDSAGNLGAVIFNHIRLYPDAPITKKLIRSKEIDSETDLLYPVYYNPQHRAHILHELEAKCHAAGIFSRLNIVS